MRVHEFAKQHNLTSKQLLEALKKKGVEVKSHMSVLPGEAIKFLQTEFLKKEAQLPVDKPVEPAKKSSSGKNPEGSLGAQKVKQPLQKASPQKASRQNRFTEQSIEKAVSAEKNPLVIEPMTLGDFAQRTGIAASNLILSLLKEGKACSINHLLSEADVEWLCHTYEIEATKPIAQKKEVLGGEKVALSQKNTEARLPVVVVMGHVDHGKTTLLDFIRKTRVAAREKGGITQHLGAYRVTTGHGDLVFLDTPGHEAFSKIRRRGASVADIAILIIAADDGIMPQTVESIKAIKALNIPAIVAINKMDRVDAQRIEVVKRQLTQHEMLPEEWGGETICVPISAKEGKGVDQLLELLALQAEMMDLKASLSAPVRGYVLESRMLKGRGPVGTVICQQGTLRVGDFFLAGSVVGKVTSLIDSSGSIVGQVGPSTPVQITGFSELPAVGALFEVVPEAEYRKARSDSSKASTSVARLSVSDDAQKFNVIIKADTHSSLEAIFDAIKKFSKNDVKEIVPVRSGIGNINESDALLAESTGAILIGFHVKAEQNAVQCARRAEVKLYLFDIIYKLLEELEAMAAREKEVKMALAKIGQATVLKVFNIKKLGVIAGCVVNEGKFSSKGIVAVVRGRKEIARGKIKSLQRDKKTVKEVHAGFECAFIVEGFDEWQVDDVAECYLNVPA